MLLLMYVNIIIVLGIIGIIICIVGLSSSNVNRIVHCNVTGIILLLIIISLSLGLVIAPIEHSEEPVEIFDLYSLESVIDKNDYFIFKTVGENDVNTYVGYINVENDTYVEKEFISEDSCLVLNDAEKPRVEIFETKSIVFGFIPIKWGNFNVIYIPTNGIHVR